MDVTKPSKFRWFGDIHGPKPYEFIGSRWALISQTPVVLPKTSTGKAPEEEPPPELTWKQIANYYLMLRNSASWPESGLPSRISPGSDKENLKNRPSGWTKAGRRAVFEVAPTESVRNPARKPDFRPGSTIA
jgi:hypothetical protein